MKYAITRVHTLPRVLSCGHPANTAAQAKTDTVAFQVLRAATDKRLALYCTVADWVHASLLIGCACVFHGSIYL